MTAGFGMSIGTVNSVWAATTGDREHPVVRVRRTAVTFDSAGGARVGGLPRFAPVVTDFADLTRPVEPVVLGGRNWTSADLVAAVGSSLITAAEPGVEPVITYPACYPGRKIIELRHALDWAGGAEALLMPEPVAAVDWLDAEYGVSGNGLTLVYDLGGASLDIAVVRTEADRDERGVLGKAVRSHEYGGRPLGAILARYARALSPGAPSPVSKVVPATDTTRLRTWNVRNSLRLVRRCVHAAGLSMRDIDRVLLIGGAARPIEVAQVLAELDRPVVMSPDPAHTVAVGAALASARMADAGSNLGRYARGAAVISSAAVVSAMAMSAATMLGSGPIGSDGPALEFAPTLAGPVDNNADLRVLPGADAEPATVSAPVGTQLSAYAEGISYSPAAQQVSPIPAAAIAGRVSSVDPSGTHCGPASRLAPPSYADPAQFTNPLPFWTPPAAQIGTAPTLHLPTISLPPDLPGTGNAAARSVSASGIHSVLTPGASNADPLQLPPAPPADPLSPPADPLSPPPAPAPNTPPAAVAPGNAPAAPGASLAGTTDSTGPVTNSSSGPGTGATGGATTGTDSGNTATSGTPAGTTSGGTASTGANPGGGTSSGSPGSGASSANSGGTTANSGGTTGAGGTSAAGSASHGSSSAGAAGGGSHGGGHH